MGGFRWWDRFGRPGRADFSRPKINSDLVLGRLRSALPGESIHRNHQVPPRSRRGFQGLAGLAGSKSQTAAVIARIPVRRLGAGSG